MDNIKTIFNQIYDIAGVFILWISLHYIASNLYPTYCTELGIMGFIKSVFYAQAPHCVAMRWVIYNGGSIINNMWVSIGVWFTGKLLTNLFNKVA